jgi:hypothetical protein
MGVAGQGRSCRRRCCCCQLCTRFQAHCVRQGRALHEKKKAGGNVDRSKVSSRWRVIVGMACRPDDLAVAVESGATDRPPPREERTTTNWTRLSPARHQQRQRWSQNRHYGTRKPKGSTCNGSIASLPLTKGNAESGSPNSLAARFPRIGANTNKFFAGARRERLEALFCCQKAHVGLAPRVSASCCALGISDFLVSVCTARAYTRSWPKARRNIAPAMSDQQAGMCAAAPLSVGAHMWGKAKPARRSPNRLASGLCLLPWRWAATPANCAREAPASRAALPTAAAGRCRHRKFINYFVKKKVALS